MAHILHECVEEHFEVVDDRLNFHVKKLCLLAWIFMSSPQSAGSSFEELFAAAVEGCSTREKTEGCSHFCVEFSGCGLAEGAKGSSAVR